MDQVRDKKTILEKSTSSSALSTKRGIKSVTMKTDLSGSFYFIFSKWLYGHKSYFYSSCVTYGKNVLINLQTKAVIV